MDNLDKSNIISNHNCKKKKKITILKFEDPFCADDSDNSLEEKTIDDSHKNQNMLPLKKRFGISLDYSNLNLRTTPHEHTKLRIQMQQDYIKSTTDKDKKLLKPKPKKAKILPGVIRHTSCPNNTLAYYYNYSVK